MNERVSFLRSDRNHSVFIHCPLEPEYREHLCALVLAVIASGHGIKGDFQPYDRFNPSFDVLAKYISESKYSIHDCSYCQIANKHANKYGRYNLPVELGMAIAERHRMQRIYNRESEKFFHEMFVFVRANHAYCQNISGLIKLNEICFYNSTIEILRAALQWLTTKETSLRNRPKFEQVQQVWEIFKERHIEHCQNEGYGVNIEDVCNDIVKLCKGTDWWKEPDWMTNQYQYDVFLAHNSKDKPDILKIQTILENDFNLRTWIDKDQIKAGNAIKTQIEEAIPRCKTIAIFFGSDIGNWQNGEIAIAIARCFEKETTVIPVLLPNLRDISKLPLFIRIFRWVEFSNLEDTYATKKSILDLVEGINGARI